MKKLVTKNSAAYWLIIAALLVFGFVGTDGFQWFQWVGIGVAVAMAVYYFNAKIQG